MNEDFSQADSSDGGKKNKKSLEIDISTVSMNQTVVQAIISERERGGNVSFTLKLNANLEKNAMGKKIKKHMIVTRVLEIHFVTAGRLLNGPVQCNVHK